jgi:hypothetical protein
MKIFVTMPDEVLGERKELGGRLVPFNPEFLSKSANVKEGRIPRNWISSNDYSAACERLRANRAMGVLATA